MSKKILEAELEVVNAKLEAYATIVEQISPGFDLDAAIPHLYANGEGQMRYIPPVET